MQKPCPIIGNFKLSNDIKSVKTRIFLHIFHEVLLFSFIHLFINPMTAKMNFTIIFCCFAKASFLGLNFAFLLRFLKTVGKGKGMRNRLFWPVFEEFSFLSTNRRTIFIKHRAE